MTKRQGSDVAVLASVAFTVFAAAAQPANAAGIPGEIQMTSVVRPADRAQPVSIEMASAPRPSLYAVLKTMPAEYRKAIVGIEMVAETKDGKKPVEAMSLTLKGGKQVTLRIDDPNATTEVVTFGVRSILEEALSEMPDRGAPAPNAAPAPVAPAAPSFSYHPAPAPVHTSQAPQTETGRFVTPAKVAAPSILEPDIVEIEEVTSLAGMEALRTLRSEYQQIFTPKAPAPVSTERDAAESAGMRASFLGS